jgi:hypothetical protein
LAGRGRGGGLAGDPLAGHGRDRLRALQDPRPGPAGPYNTFPYIFAGWIVLGLAWYLVLKVRDPARAARLGSLQELETADLESHIAAELTTP